MDIKDRVAQCLKEMEADLNDRIADSYRPEGQKKYKQKPYEGLEKIIDSDSAFGNMDE